MKDHSSQVTVLLGQSNFLETVTMQPQDDLMPLFIIAPIVVICLAVAFLLVKRKR